jgi:hypothetical protein
VRLCSQALVEEIYSSDTSVLTRATRRHIPDGHDSENPKSYPDCILLLWEIEPQFLDHRAHGPVTKWVILAPTLGIICCTRLKANLLFLTGPLTSGINCDHAKEIVKHARMPVRTMWRREQCIAIRRESNTDPLALQPVASRCSVWPIPTTQQFAISTESGVLFSVPLEEWKVKQNGLQVDAWVHVLI